MNALSTKGELEKIDLSVTSIPPEVIEILPDSLARYHKILPVMLDCGTLTVVGCGFDADLIQKLRFILNHDIHPVLASPDQIAAALDRFYPLTGQDLTNELRTNDGDGPRRYSFAAFNLAGEAVSGLIEARNEDEALRLIKESELFVFKLDSE